MKKSTLLIIYLLATHLAFAQTSAFNTYQIAEVGSILIPDNMVAKVNKSQKNADPKQKSQNVKVGYTVSGNDILFYPKGLKKKRESDIESTSTIKLSTTIARKGTYQKLSAHLSLAPDKLLELSEKIRGEYQKTIMGTSTQLVLWIGTSIETINGRSAWHVSYLQSYGGGDVMVVDRYVFQNNDRVHELTLTFKKSEAKLWNPLFKKVRSSFLITNVR